MHFLMTALGSYGDVHPIAGLGGELCRRGHEVSIIANPNFQPVIEGVGAEFIPLGTLDDYQVFAENADVWHPIKGPMLAMELGIVKFLRDLYALIESKYRAAETVLVAHPLDFASRIFQERHQAPLASVILAPLMFRSLHESPKLGVLLMSNWVPRWFRGLQFWVADKVVDRIICPTLNQFRSELGLTPVRRVFHQWIYSPQLVMGLFPDWFGSIQPDWPRQLRLTGFPLWDQPDGAGLPTEVEEFLRDGEPPIVFTPGSAMAHGQEFFQAAVEACQTLGRRGILLSKYTGHLPNELPAGVQHFGFVPFSQLLSRASAVVHHGGIGSCAQGLAAGLPQLLMPMAYDQPDNAARLKRLGVAQSLSPKQFRGPAVARALDGLLSDPAVDQRCHQWAQQCDSTTALTMSCELLEGLLTRQESVEH